MPFSVGFCDLSICNCLLVNKALAGGRTVNDEHRIMKGGVLGVITRISYWLMRTDVICFRSDPQYVIKDEHLDRLACNTVHAMSSVWLCKDIVDECIGNKALEILVNYCREACLLQVQTTRFRLHIPKLINPIHPW